MITSKAGQLFKIREYALVVVYKKKDGDYRLIPATVEARNLFNAKLIAWASLKRFGIRLSDIYTGKKADA